LSKTAAKNKDAAEYLAKAHKIGGHQSNDDIQRLWQSCEQSKLSPVLAPPISGEDFALDSARFERLMNKTQLAISEKRMDDAQRYLLMSGDIPNFARHPQRRRLLSKIPTVL
jgi:hypothetical protein